MIARRLLSLLIGIAFVGVAATASAERIVYEVQPGDMLGAIALRYGVTIEQLIRWNDGLDPDRIREGQQLVVYPQQSGGYQTYVIAPGDTLGGIAEQHDVTVSELVSWNRGLEPDRIRAGDELRIRQQGRPSRRVTYVVQPGDFLSVIAADHDVTIAQLRAWNPGLDPDRIRDGQELVMILEGPETRSESVGLAHGGQLVNGEQLPPHAAYVIRNERVAWGTNETVSAILDGFDHMRRTFDDLPRVRVHDLSDEDGGRLAGHRSHQSGRDADIGFYHTGCGETCAYQSFSPSELDVERQWELFRYWFDHDLVDYIFVDYRYQEVLYEYVREQGASEAQLREWFQYPAGRDVARGIIRHEPGHRDHLHVRFRCDGDDEGCR